MRRFSAFLLAGLLLTACADDPKENRAEKLGADPIIFTSYAAADHLVQTMNGRLDPAKPLLVTTLADLTNLEESSPLGRLIAEQLVSRLANAGYVVNELKLRQGLLVREGEGQFILSRDGRQIAQAAGAQAVIAGTFTQAKTGIYVNLKMIQASDGRILGAHDYLLPIDDNVRHLNRLSGTRY